MHSKPHLPQRSRANLFSRLFPTLGVLCLVCCFAACSKHTAIWKFLPTSRECWESTDTLRFIIPPLAETGNYDLSVGIRTTVAPPYPFQCIWLVVKQHWHAPERTQLDTIQCKLADARGETNGQGMTRYTFSFPVKTAYYPQRDSADVCVYHIMRSEMLQGIDAVGIRLEKAQ